MQVPVPLMLSVTTPDGRSSTRSVSRSTDLADNNDVLSVTHYTELTTVNGHVSATDYDAAAHTITRTSPAGRQGVTTLDARGRVVAQQLASGVNPVNYAYDARGQLTQVRQGSLSNTYTYDARGQVVARADALGNVVRYVYDDAGRLKQSTLPGGSTYSFGYDANGNRTQIIMPNGAAHVLASTGGDRDAHYTPADGDSYSWVYDSDGARTRASLPSGRNVDSTYDPGGRNSGFTYPEASVAITYGLANPTSRAQRIGRATTNGGPAQDILYTYSGDLLVGMQTTGITDGLFAYTYDADSFLSGIRVTSRTDTVQTALARDADGLLASYGPFTIARNGPGGAVSQMADGNASGSLGYDALARLSNRTNVVGTQGAYSAQLSYDAAGRLTQKIEVVSGSAHTDGYRYDPDGQLLEVARDGIPVEAYTYDVNHNRISRGVDANSAEVAAYDSQDRITQQGGIGYQFDADGYLSSSGTSTFQYSTRGELLRATVAGQSVTYGYDGLARRVARTDGQGTDTYLYGDPGNPLRITNIRDAAGVLSTLYYDEGGSLIAVERSGARFYVATDQVGTPRVVSDALGRVVKTMDFTSFGVPTLDTNPAFDMPIGYAGGLADTATGLVRFGFRDYDPVAGRWVARDPALFQAGQPNLYVYLNNDPIDRRDPSGLWSIGGSIYEGIGFGARIAFNSDGISLCTEIGWGRGFEVSVDPLAKPETRDSLTVPAEVEVRVLGVRLTTRASLDDCGKAEASTQLCGGPFCADDAGGASVKASDADHFGKSIGELMNETGQKIEGKVAATSCLQHKW